VSDSDKPGTSAELPFAVHQVSSLMSDYIARLGNTWIEGQISEIRETRALTYLKLRDIDRDATLSVYIQTDAIRQITPAIEQGSRVVLQAKADWWPKKGSLQFKILQLRAVGLGELMARLEALRNILAAEGLFDADRKKPIPFLPRRIGLVCGQNSDAMFDVVENAKRRWPDVEFVIREVAVQGASAVRQVSDAITELDAIDDVDVIVVARGGGAFEDLLPFSDESLIRVVAKCITPLVAAIGHEEDRPLIDYVADYRASTPTDAARRIVPDVVQELAELRNIRTRAWQIASTRLVIAEQDIASLRSRPALAHPSELIDQRIADLVIWRTAMFTRVDSAVALESSKLNGFTATLRALSPQGTLERGYAIVRKAGAIVRTPSDVSTSDEVTIRIAGGEIAATINS
jgi:exodeoxyribonuclease VII large subunit